jgi:thioester reductase-like protein
VTEARSRLNTCIRRIAPDLVDWGQMRAIDVVCGDITDGHLGLTCEAWNELSESVTHIIHAAASTQWHLPLECARAVNVSGTANVLRLARQARKRGRLVKLAHLSTAYVCGEMSGSVTEVNHLGALHFANTYEQTKWEAEQELLSAKDDLPMIIVRPSITVGDSRTGLAVTYNVLYPPLKYILTGKLTALSCPPHNRLDLVPVDYVAKAVTHLTLNSPSLSGQIYHLTAGLSRSSSIASIVKRAIAVVSTKGMRPSDCSFAEPHESAKGELRSNRKAVALMEMYSSYLRFERDFDDRNARQALKDSDIRLPDIDSYLDVLLQAFISHEILNNRRIAGTAQTGSLI